MAHDFHGMQGSPDLAYHCAAMQSIFGLRGWHRSAQFENSLVFSRIENSGGQIVIDNDPRRGEVSMSLGQLILQKM